ncbi:MAG: hypothetical protein GY854_14945 [Deltaproteobacteria bacterium]|nr:hypothetical protein [Deltaproteobacteria bacterium]
MSPALIAEQLPTLPALKKLGQLSDVRPVIVVDTREQDPLFFKRLFSVRGTLVSGDYSILSLEGQFAIERKSIADLVSCCVGNNRERFERELHRLSSYRFARLLVVGSRESIERGEYRSRIPPKSVLHSLAAWEARHNVPTVFIPTPEEASLQIETWAYWFAREIVQAANDLLRGHKKATSDTRREKD